MDYQKGYVYELMDKGGPTDTREAYFKEAVEEMMRARTLCAKANAAMPDDPAYVGYLEELFGRKLNDVRILTPFICDFGNRVKFGKGVFINQRHERAPHPVHLRKSVGQEERMARHERHDLPRSHDRSICCRCGRCGRHKGRARLCRCGRRPGKSDPYA